MVHSVKQGKTERQSYSKINEVIDVPNLIDNQRQSYQWFIDEGMQQIFDEISPITDDQGKYEVYFVGKIFDSENPCDPTGKEKEGKELDAKTKEAADWLFDDARKQGDVFVQISSDNRTVKVYYFEKSAPAWLAEAKDAVINENVTKLKESLKANNPQYVINFDLVKKFIYG